MKDVYSDLLWSDMREESFELIFSSIGALYGEIEANRSKLNFEGIISYQKHLFYSAQRRFRNTGHNNITFQLFENGDE